MGGHERPDALEALAQQPHREPAVSLLLEQLVGAAVPDLDGACSVLAGRDHTFEIGVVERVILDVDGEMPLPFAKRDALRNRPARQSAVAFEPKVVVEPPRIVSLNDEAELVPRRPPGLRTALESSLDDACGDTRRCSPVDCRPKRNAFFTKRLQDALFPCSDRIHGPGISLWKVGKTQPKV